MSTRAIISLEGDNFEFFRLYSPYDSYVKGGVGEALYNFINSQTSCISIRDVLYELLTFEDFLFELEGSTGVDYVYKIICSSKFPPKLICYEVDWLGDNNRPISERLSEPLNIEKILQEEEEQEPKIKCCPTCGRPLES